MNVELKSISFDKSCQRKCDALIILLPKGTSVASSSSALTQWVAAAQKQGALGPNGASSVSAFADPRFTPKQVQVVLVDPSDPDGVRAALRGAAKGLSATAQAITVSLQLLMNAADESAVDWMHLIVAALGEATYNFTTSKAKTAKKSWTGQFTLAVDAAPRLKREFDRAVAVMAGMNLAKEWANRPANLATPSLLADEAKRLAKFKNMRVEVLGPKEVAKLKMGAFMAVAQGSAQPLRFIVVRYHGTDAAKAPVVLVGKGITFDTGGISLKPGAEMDEMKFDMCGAASVMGAMHAIGHLQPKQNVVALIPSCENMPDAAAVKPGDVVTSMSGQTIEILNTDAEGRLILCDALTYAKRFKPAHVIDVATLTGACVIALGHVRSGMFTADDALAAALHEAGEQTRDLCWRMPLDEAYGKSLKSNFADIPNIGGGRAGGSITAAKFLEKFTDAFKWAHLDIAGSAWDGGAAKGATGRPVPLLVHHVLSAGSSVSKRA
jgi:leucyl aminopeptidase